MKITVPRDEIEKSCWQPHLFPLAGMASVSSKTRGIYIPRSAEFARARVCLFRSAGNNRAQARQVYRRPVVYTPRGRRSGGTNRRAFSPSLSRMMHRLPTAKLQKFLRQSCAALYGPEDLYPLSCLGAPHELYGDSRINSSASKLAPRFFRSGGTLPWPISAREHARGRKN